MSNPTVIRNLSLQEHRYHLNEESAKGTPRTQSIFISDCGSLRILRAVLSAYSALKSILRNFRKCLILRLFVIYHCKSKPSS